MSLRKFLRAHKVISVVAVVAVLGGGLWWHGKQTTTAEAKYLVTPVARGSVIVSVSGSGQVAAGNQIDLKTKASGDVSSLPVVVGQTVATGSLVLTLDAKNAQKAVRDAQVSLEGAQLSLEKLKKPADELALTQANNALFRAREKKETAQTDLLKTYDDASTAVANAFLALPLISTGLHDILFTSSAGLTSSGEWNIDAYTAATNKYDNRAFQYKDAAKTRFDAADRSYNTTFAHFKSTSRFDSASSTEAILDETLTTTRQLAEAVKSANNLIQFYKDQLKEHNQGTAAVADTHLTSIADYTGKLNTHMSALLAVQTSLANDKDAIVDADRSISENTESLQKTTTGADALDIAASELTIKQRRNAFQDAQEALADYAVRAPFSGTIAKLNVKRTDSLGSGAVVATLITREKIAEISLNEVDTAQVKVGQKATLTFDAIDGLSLTGVLSELDAVGTISQGVVTYTAKIAFDAQDARVKPGMSVSAHIITSTKHDVLIVPNTAVKTQNGSSYVEMFDAPLAGGTSAQGATSITPPRRQPVESGLADDANTEIVSGLAVDDEVVTRTISPTASKPAPAQAPSLFGATGGNRAPGGVRPQGR